MLPISSSLTDVLIIGVGSQLLMIVSLSPREWQMTLTLRSVRMAVTSVTSAVMAVSVRHAAFKYVDIEY